jgi:phosphoenolpyruvate carboxykinase (ATP)
MYHFISGYTAKVAGTEAGVTEPTATFSACFGAPFMVLHPYRYAELLAKHIREHKVTCWLVNTGWTGGPYGEGKRMSIAHTRALLNAALTGELSQSEFMTDPYFGVDVPKSCPGVPETILQPKNTWKNPDAYDKQAAKLVRLFEENFKAFEDDVPDAVKAAGPSAASRESGVTSQ